MRKKKGPGKKRSASESRGKSTTKSKVRSGPASKKARQKKRKPKHTRHKRKRPIKLRHVWRCVGPSAATGLVHNSRVGGRVNWMAIGPMDDLGHQAMFLATVGGVWRSRDFTTPDPTWEPMTDQLPSVPLSSKGSLSMMSVSFDRWHPGRVYAGTGDYDSPSRGVLMSNDGGETWQLLGGDTLSGQGALVRVFADPTDRDSRRLFACGSRIFMSSDGGASWELRHAGFGAPLFDESGDRVVAQDLVWQIDPITGNLILIAAITVNDPQFTLNQILAGFYRSDDYGATWTRMVVQSFTDCTSGQEVDTSWFGPVRMATASPSFGTPIYAIVSNQNVSTEMKPDGTVKWPYSRLVLNLFKLDPISGWSPLFKSGFEAITQSGYSMAIATGPGESVFFGAIGGPYESNDGGKTWNSLVPEKPTGTAPHVDEHCILHSFDGGEDPRLYVATDGAVYRYEYAASAWWSVSTESLTNFYLSSATVRRGNINTVLSDGQDNGCNWRDAASGAWSMVKAVPPPGDEYGRLRYDHDGNTAYWVRSGGGVYRSVRVDGGEFIPTFAPDPPGMFYPALALDPRDASRVALGWDPVMESQAFGINWQPLSQLGEVPIAGVLAYAANRDLWVAAGDQLWRYSRQQMNWRQLAPNQAFGGITAIAIDPINPELAAFLCTSSGQVWQTLDGGITWTDISSGLPAGACKGIALLNDKGAWTLFVGTSVGVWSNVFPNGAPGPWVLYGIGLPEVPINDLDFDEEDRTIAVATEGRSVWLVRF